MVTKAKVVESSQSIGQSQPRKAGKARQYIVWNREMDSALTFVLLCQINQGNKADGDWKPQAYQAAVEHLNSTLHLNLTKKNVKK